jgi:hypothetical protein
MCWQCDNPDKTVEDYLELIRGVIASHGWFIQYDEKDRWRPGFAYTVGLTPIGHSELLVTGLTPEMAGHFLNSIAHQRTTSTGQTCALCSSSTQTTGVDGRGKWASAESSPSSGRARTSGGLSSTRGSAARSPAVDGLGWHCAADLRKRVGGRWPRTVAADAPATHLPRTDASSARLWLALVLPRAASSPGQRGRRPRC